MEWGINSERKTWTEAEGRTSCPQAPPKCPLLSEWREGAEVSPACSELPESGLLTTAPPAPTAVAVGEPEPEPEKQHGVESSRLLVNVVCTGGHMGMSGAQRCVSQPFPVLWGGQ